MPSTKHHIRPRLYIVRHKYFWVISLPRNGMQEIYRCDYKLYRKQHSAQSQNTWGWGFGVGRNLPTLLQPFCNPKFALGFGPGLVGLVGNGLPQSGLYPAKPGAGGWPQPELGFAHCADRNCGTRSRQLPISVLCTEYLAGRNRTDGFQSCQPIMVSTISQDGFQPRN